MNLFRRTRRSRLFAPRCVAVAGLLAGLALSLTSEAAEIVILKDGFVIQGNIRKEVTMVNDPATGRPVPVPKDTGFDMVDEGPKIMIFSAHAKQLGEVGKDVKLRPELKAYTRNIPPRKRTDPLPPGATTRSTTEFNAGWLRTLTVNVPLGFDNIEQLITHLDPYYCYIWSPTHIWRLSYRTTEMGPAKVRKLLSTHPDLIQEPNKPDATKRIAIARFMLDAGWLQEGQNDLDEIKKDFLAIPKEAKDEFDRLVKDVDIALATMIIKEAEFALNAGRYTYAAEALSAFPEKTAEPKQTDDVTKLMAQLKASKEQYESGRKMLRSVIEEITGNGRANPLIVAGGGTAMVAWKSKPLTSPQAALVAAAEEVHAELHPDSVSRVEFFVNLATQAQREKMQGRDPTKKPDELLATAISGWVKGKNGATADPEVALKLWAAREAVLGFQRSNDLNSRNVILTAYKKGTPVPIDELAQVISLLPPAKPENLVFRTGTLLPAKNGVPPGTYKRTTGPSGNYPSGQTYFAKLPPEYHHGRAYPVMIVLGHPGVDPEQALGTLAFEADRNGYILLAPAWGGVFNKQGWEWKGEDHEQVTAVLRDAVRHFCIDNDKVFLFGAADGANMAMDIGMSHPDLFAGVLAMGPVPKWANMFNNYWKNAQKLPFYVVTGEQSGVSFVNLRHIYEQWTKFGYPSVMAVYKGRGIEWYTAEIPVMFDWMSRKKRVNGAATLNLQNGVRHPWQTMRSTDNRFYWLGVDKIADRFLIENLKTATSQVLPAQIQGDIGGNNQINITTRGVTKLSVWLSQDMIEWTKPVAVNVDGSGARDSAGQLWRPKLITPDLDTLLEDYRERGDRRMLFLRRLEFSANNQ